jgi:hypothetical protein
MPVSDSAIYQSAWNEAMRRVIVRDTILGAYITAAGALTIASRASNELALGIPFLTFIAGCMIAHHDFMIASLNKYIRQFRPEDSGTTLWHSRHLRGPLIIGLLLYTTPVIIIFSGYSWAAMQMVQKIPPGEYPHLRYWAPVAAYLGLGALMLGRGRQIWVLKNDERSGGDVRPSDASRPKVEPDPASGGPAT